MSVIRIVLVLHLALCSRKWNMCKWPLRMSDTVFFFQWWILFHYTFLARSLASITFSFSCTSGTCKVALMNLSLPTNFCKICGFHSGHYEECRLLGYDAVYFLLEPMFRRNISPSSSR
jgi:hypothetical protein